jgi:Ca2+-dependent lipid-binding protein
LPSTIRSLNPIFDVGKVEIKIYQARGLSAKDITGKSDPFCIIELDSNRLRTHTIYKTLNPIWNKSFVIPVQDIHSVMEITIYDEDTNKSNEFIGKIAIPLLAVKKKKFLFFFIFIDFY